MRINVSIYMYIYIHMYTLIHTYIFINIYIYIHTSHVRAKRIPAPPPPPLAPLCLTHTSTNIDTHSQITICGPFFAIAIVCFPEFWFSRCTHIYIFIQITTNSCAPEKLDVFQRFCLHMYSCTCTHRYLRARFNVKGRDVRN